MNKELLSIGEMAKLNGVGIKALRYYEKIGLLLPAYVNKETGYRYYTLNQSAEIDIILTCIELGIPLKQVLDFKVSEGSLDMKHLLQFGKEKAEEKLQRLQMRQHQLDSYIKGMNERDKLATRISSSKFLIKEISANNFDIKEYIKGTTCLYQAKIRFFALLKLIVLRTKN